MTDIDAWKRALQSLTPGGSEFTEPHECEAYVRRRDNERWETIKRMKYQRDQMEARVKMADELLRFVEDTIGTDNRFMQDWLKRYEAALIRESDQQIQSTEIARDRARLMLSKW